MWSVAALTAGFAVVRNDGEELVRCPSSGPCVWVDGLLKWFVIGGAVLGIAAFLGFGLSLIGFLLTKELPSLARLGLGLMLFGLPLIFAFGLGLALVVPGLVVASVGLRATPHWQGPVLMTLALVATFFLAEPLDDGGNLSGVQMMTPFCALTLFGAGWVMFGWSIGRESELTGSPEIFSS